CPASLAGGRACHYGRVQLTSDLADTARRLREDALALLEETGLLHLLEDRYGTAVITGSAEFDLMVRRSIDIHMPVAADAWMEWAGLGAVIAARLAERSLVLHEASFLNDYVDPHPLGAGLYWGLQFRDSAGNAWKCDLWGWEPLDFAVRQARDDGLRIDLARADRELILRLKSEAQARGDDF